jgi:parvulin-like peptidyl-prolyl isomerase
MDEFFRSRCWSCTALWAGVALLLAGCESLGTTKKFAHPVVPPPPRTRLISKDRGENTNPADGAAAGTKASDGARSAAGHSSLVAADPPQAPPAESDQSESASPESAPSDSDRTDPKTQDEPPGFDDVNAAVALNQVSGTGSQIQQMGYVTDPTGQTPFVPGNEGSLSQPRRKPKKERKPPDELALKSSTETEGSGWKVERGEVAALVNGVPIFVDDVLAPLGPNLARMEKEMPRDQFRKQRAAFVNQWIKPHIEQELLLQALKTKLKEEQLTQIQKHIDKMIDEDLHKVMKKMGFATMGELAVELRKNGSSIESRRTQFRNRMLSQQYLSSRINPKAGFDRPDILEHYQETPTNSRSPATAKWQQIQLLFARHGGMANTKKLAEKVMKRLEEGEDFATLAKEYSDGPTASQGGHWDWTIESSLKSKELDAALFEMPTGGQECAMIESADAIDIVIVIDRRAAGSKSFESVQENIKAELKRAEFHRTVQELFAELTEKATIEMHPLE